MVGEPNLTTLPLTSDPIPHNISLIGVSLSLDDLPIIELSSQTSCHSWISRYSLSPEVKLSQPRDLRDINSGSISCAARGADRSHVVMGDRIQIQRRILPHKWQTIREVEVAVSRPWIVSSEFLVRRSIVRIVEAMPESSQRHRSMTLAAPDDGSLKSKLKVLRRTEGEHRGVHPGGIQIGMPLDASHKEIVPDRT